MILPVKYKNNDELYSKYISIFQWELKLTERETQILINLIKDFDKFVKESDEADIIVFSSDNINRFCKNNNLSIQQYHNIKNALIDKKALYKDKYGRLMVNRLLLPKSEITFKFQKNER